MYLNCHIGDLGLSQPADVSSQNNEIYGVIPYIAPEVLNGANFSKESDIYSFGMVMWELTSGRKPFDYVEHDHNLIYQIIDGKRPDITQDTPDFYANLMKRCWDPDPSKRPLIAEIKDKFDNLYDPCFFLKCNNEHEIIKRCEEKRLELIQSMKLGPEFSEKPHPKAIYTSRALSSMTFKTSSTSTSSLTISSITNQEYFSREFDFDINNIHNMQNIKNFRTDNV
ncbi:3383_t:CDS:2 [Funneliformis geosporum]|nr:3383_t:CDS:2 [Funneliformis geosporum]